MIHRLTRALHFPDLRDIDESGILAIGGDLSPERVLLAYRSGIFPWILDGRTIEWHCPDPRFVLFPDKLRVTASLARVIRSGRFTVTFDRDFAGVINGCRMAPRPAYSVPWITPTVVHAYTALHKAGHAHSVEVWQDNALVGGLYGVAVGRCFCGESMFHRVPNASKVGFVAQIERLEQAGCELIDCQVHTDHLASFGAEALPRTEFLMQLRHLQHHTATLPTEIPLDGQVH